MKHGYFLRGWTIIFLMNTKHVMASNLDRRTNFKYSGKMVYSRVGKGNIHCKNGDDIGNYDYRGRFAIKTSHLLVGCFVVFFVSSRLGFGGYVLC